MQDACCWCHRIVKMPDTHDRKDPKKDVVCSKECAEQERRFRFYYSDEMIGERNYRDHGVNPTELMKRRKK